MQEQTKLEEPKIKWDINTILKLSVAVAALLIGLSIAYYFVIYIPGKDKARERGLNAQKYYNQLQYDGCITEAQSRYHETWEGICRASNKEKNCNLPLMVAERVDEQLRKDKEECRRVYLE